MNSIPLAKRIGIAIRVCRKRRRLSQEQVARALSTARSYVSKLEHGKVNASVATLEKLISVLKIDVADLFVEDQDQLMCPDTNGESACAPVASQELPYPRKLVHARKSIRARL